MGSRERRANRLRIIEEQHLVSLGLPAEEEVVEKPKAKPKTKAKKSFFSRKKSGK